MVIRDKVVCVTEEDKVIGEMEKMLAHHEGTLHRAFSILIFNELGEMLIHRRASSKYHSPGLWTNACCSHPQLNETYKEGAEERLMTELGFTVSLKEVHHFIYKAFFDNGLIEHEFDRVFIGNYNGNIPFNRDEVDEIKWIRLEDLYEDINQDPKKYTEWFKILMKENKLNPFL